MWPEWGFLGKSFLSLGFSDRQLSQRFIPPVDLPMERKAGGGEWKGLGDAPAGCFQAASEPVSTAELSWAGCVADTGL